MLAPTELAAAHGSGPPVAGTTCGVAAVAARCDCTSSGFAVESVFSPITACTSPATPGSTEGAC